MGVLLREFESKAALEAYLSGSVNALIGRQVEAPRRYYALAAADANGAQVLIGVLSNFGVRPAWAFSLDGHILVLGYDATVTFVSLVDLRPIASTELDGVFFEFIKASDNSYVLAIHELGVVKFDFQGRLLWSIPTPDIAEGAQMQNDDILVVRHQGRGKEVVIDVRNGRLLPTTCDGPVN